MICRAKLMPEDPAALELLGEAMTGEPLYVLPTDLLPATSWPAEKVFGLFNPNLAASLETELRDRREWCGDCPALLLNFDGIIEHLAALVDDAPLQDEMIREWTLAIACHEIAHLLDVGIVKPEKHLAAVVRIALQCEHRPPDAGSETFAPAPFALHTVSWIRALLHVVHRAQILTGIAIPISVAADLSRYDLSPIYLYQDALDDEPERLADLPIAEILDRDFPVAFLELWRADVARFYKTVNNREV